MIPLHSQTWTPETIRDIHSRADGGYSLTGYSTFRPLPSFDDLVFLASGLTRFPLEGYREKSRTETVLGPRSARPLHLELPIYIASSTDFPQAVRSALASGAALARTAFSVGGPLIAGEKKQKGRAIFEVEAGAALKKPVRPPRVGAVQLNPGQISSDALKKLVTSLRREQELRVPIFVSLGTGCVRDGIRAAVDAGVDGVVLMGLDTGPISDPRELYRFARVPMVAALGEARETLLERKVLGEVSLIAGNGVLTGADAAKALALGAEAVAIQDSALVAFGLQGSRDKGSGELVAKYLNSMIMEVALISRSLGKGDVHSLEPEDLAALTVEASLMSGVRLAGE